VPPQHVQAEQELHVVALHDGHAAGQELVADAHRRLRSMPRHLDEHARCQQRLSEQLMMMMMMMQSR